MKIEKPQFPSKATFGDEETATFKRKTLSVQRVNYSLS